MVLVASTTFFAPAAPATTGSSAGKDPRVGVVLVILGCMAQGVQCKYRFYFHIYFHILFCFIFIFSFCFYFHIYPSFTTVNITIKQSIFFFYSLNHLSEYRRLCCGNDNICYLLFAIQYLLLFLSLFVCYHIKIFHFNVIHCL